MSWRYLTCRFPDEATAIAAARQLGTVLTPGTEDAGNDKFALHVFDQWDRLPGTNGKADPGQAAAGFWVNVAFNEDWEGAAAADAALQPFVQTPAVPGNVFA